MTRAEALLDAAITVQRWRAMPRYERERVRRHVARALRCPPFLERDRSGNCGAADGGTGCHRDLRPARGSRRLGPEIAKPALGRRGLCIPAKSREILSCGKAEISLHRRLLQALFRATLDVRPDAAPRALSAGGRARV